MITFQMKASNFFIIAVITIGLLSSNLAYATVHPGMIRSFPYPLHQIKNGVEAKNVTCQDGLVLMIKSRDNSPACVRPQTAQKLMERGWGKMASENLTNTELLCTANGGKWDAKYKECVGISSKTCNILNGTFNNCASACRHETSAAGEPKMCIAVCVQVCSIK